MLNITIIIRIFVFEINNAVILKTKWVLTTQSDFIIVVPIVLFVDITLWYSRTCKADKATDRCTCKAADDADLNHVSEPLIRFLDKANHNDVVAEYVVLWVAFKSLNIQNLFTYQQIKCIFKAPFLCWACKHGVCSNAA